ncbi:MAG: T9SS type A sorting domain-containing protein [Balneolaceae bacterium]
MRKIYYSVFTLFALLLTFNTTQAQLFEDFEDAEKRAYAAGSVDQSSGTWYLDDALIQGGDDRDLKNGNHSIRIREGFARMEFDNEDGANELQFLAGNSDFSGDGGGKIQVFYSTDGGSIWTEIGDEITLTSTLDEYTVAAEMEEAVRFRFDKTAGGRINIDDVRINDFIVAEEEATIDVFVDGSKIEDEESVTFASTLVGTEREKVVEIKNRGNEELNISEVLLATSAFTISDLTDSTLAFNEGTELTLTFAPESEGIFNEILTVNSNAVNTASFMVNLSGEGIEDGEVMEISDARQLPFGSRVTVAGRVTVANQFDGPVHIQDESGAIPVYFTPMHTAVELGDSVKVTGPLYYPPYAEDNPEDFSIQITTTPSDNNVTFEILEVERKEVEPKVITALEMNSGEFESQLVLIENAAFSSSGVFEGETNYDFSDGTSDALIRIDGDADDIVGAAIPNEPLNIVGVVDQFAGDYQLKPRFVEDLGVESVTLPGEDVSRDLTFEVVTWNIEWFGNSGNGPDDEALQLENVKSVIDSLDADIFALQEISNESYFSQLVTELDEYGGVIADFSQNQKTAYLFKRATIDSLDSGLIETGMTQSNWANGRYPLMFHFDATIGDITQQFYAYNIHAKAFGDQSSYEQRLNASREMKTYLDNSRSQDNVIFLGDYNDEITTSTATGNDSPYKNFVEDTEYTIITQSLEEEGFSSHSQGSFLDHITITSELMDEYIPGTERRENTSYIGSYLSTTSDHYPIWMRFQFETVVSNEEILADNPSAFTLEQNYPNPFNPTTVIGYQLPVASNVSLEVFDMLGQKVATLVEGRQSAGQQSVNFDASALSSGVYIYRLSAGNGQQITKKMLLIK